MIAAAKLLAGAMQLPEDEREKLAAPLRDSREHDIQQTAAGAVG